MDFDHDVGEGWTKGMENGYDVAKWIEERAYNGTLKSFQWRIHTDNKVGGKNILAALMNADKFWKQHEEQQDGLV